MKYSHNDIRYKFKNFFSRLDHKEVPPIPLVPQNDPTTLFTGSGMQQLLPYLLGQQHPLGNKLYNIQPCLRAQDIEEVGDNRHDTFFEMMGNWSLGDYFKKEQLENLFIFLTDNKIGLGLDPNKLYATVYMGDEELPEDRESIEIWSNIFKKAKVSYKINERIFKYDANKNWWSRAGTPDKMPAGEPGGPDSEIFYDFGTPHNKIFGVNCHPNCDCGRFMEIGNSVFMQYKKLANGKFENLPKMNVDFGGGLERLLSAANNEPDNFKTDVFSHIINSVEEITKKKYDDLKYQSALRIIADHIKTSVFIIKWGITPSNKEQGYVLRRLLRRSLVKIRQLNKDFSINSIAPIVESVLNTYDNVYFSSSKDRLTIIPIIEDEINKFHKTLERGLKEIEKIKEITAQDVFNLYQSYGFPIQITQEILKEQGKEINNSSLEAEISKHKLLSKSSVNTKFKGGLADNSYATIKYHTATHLIHQALFDTLGSTVRQEGSNITGERLRFDFYTTNLPTKETASEIEAIVNSKINESLYVENVLLSKNEAEKIGAKSFFREKYPETVSVFYISKEKGNIKDAYSKEFCGGPHVDNVKEIGKITIQKLSKIGVNMYRIYAY